MLRRAWSALGLALVFLVLACRSSSGPTLAKPLLWAAQKDGRTLYFLGTMHAGFNAEKQLPKWVWDKLAAAPALAVEADITDPRLMTFGVRQDGSTLRQELGEEHWKKLVAELGQGAAADHMTAAGALMVLQAKSFPPTMAMDLMLLGEAESAKKKVVYLEDGVAALTMAGKWLDVRALRAALDDVAKGKRAAVELLAAYVSGDPARIEKISDQRADFIASGRTAAEYDAMMDDLLYKRNAAWIEGIERLHGEADGALVAVGTLHLIGKRSVLELLAARGFSVQRVTGP